MGVRIFMFCTDRIHFAIMNVARARPPRFLFYSRDETHTKSRQSSTDAGVYLFKDALGNILYVGKSRSLRNRVRSYFLESRWRTPRPVPWCAKLPISITSS